MSSTNRSNARDSHVADYYITPVDKIEEFLRAFGEVESIFYDDIKILDPCAGGDYEHPMSYPQALRNIGVESEITTLDIREDSKAELTGNYLTYNFEDYFDVIITNPPFALAREVIEKALDDVPDSGFVIMLLRLNFLEGKNRKDLYDKQLPKYIFVHHKRMSFTDDGKTDSVAYAHYVWQKGHNPKFTQLKVI